MLCVQTQNVSGKTNRFAIAEVSAVRRAISTHVHEHVPPFGNAERVADIDRNHLLTGQITGRDVIAGSAVAVKRGCEEVADVRVIERGRQFVFVGVRQLKGIGVLRAQKSIAFVIGQLIEFRLEGVQALVCWPVDSAAIGEGERVVGVVVVGQACIGEQVQVIPANVTISLRNRTTQLPVRLSMLQSKPDLPLPFSFLFLE